VPTKKRQHRGSRLLWTIFIGLILAGGYYFLSLPVWEIKEVTVNGTKLLSADQLRVLAGIPLSENLFFTSFARARSNLNKIKAIKKYHIFRLPPGTVIINIQERRPVASVILPNLSAVIDEQGYILNANAAVTLNLPNLAELPVVAGVSDAQVINNEELESTTTAVITGIIPKITGFTGAKRIQLNLGGLVNINLLLDDLLLVRLGDQSQISRKMAVLEALLPQVSGRWAQTAYLDVRYPDAPVIRFK
jgi:cell division protein FtsQ